MNIRRFATLAIGMALMACVGLAAENPRQLTRDQAARDARAFVRLLETSHPDPYSRMGGKIAFKRRAAELVDGIPAAGLAVPELADRLAMFVAPLRDGHTNIQANRDKWKKPVSPIGLQFRIASDGLFLSASDLPSFKGTRGGKLAGVNGRPVAELLNKVKAEVASENDYGAYRALANALRNPDLLKSILPDLDRVKGAVFNLENPDGERMDRIEAFDAPCDPDPGKWLEKPLVWTGYDRSSDVFYYRFLDDGRTAYFRVGSMTGRESIEIYWRQNIGNWRERLKQYYKEQKREMPGTMEEVLKDFPSVFEQGTLLLNEMKLRKTPNLVIDVRRNGGGATSIIVPFFLQMFGDIYYERQSPGESVTVKSQIYLDKYNSSVEKERKTNPDFELGDYEFEPVPRDKGEDRRRARIAEWKKFGFSHVPALEALDGKPFYTPEKIVVLCDEATFSAAFQMMFYLHQLGAKVVGVPSSQAPNTFMEATEYILPESGIAGSISNSVQWFMPENPDADVFRPDFEVSYSVFKRYGFDEDTVLRYALDLIKEGKI